MSEKEVSKHLGLTDLSCSCENPACDSKLPISDLARALLSKLVDKTCFEATPVVLNNVWMKQASDRVL
jgi:hypothetical protein